MAKYDFKTRTDDGGVEDIELDANGEWNFTSTIQESLAQRLSHRLNTWQGEWVYNLNYGTPYEQRLLSSGISKDQADAEILRVISLEDDITSISEVISTKNNTTRVYEIERVEVFCDNETLTIPISLPSDRTNNYPEPKEFEDFQICSLGDATEEEINELYYLINFAMSDFNNITVDVGETTWWNTWSDNLP